MLSGWMRRDWSRGNAALALSAFCDWMRGWLAGHFRQESGNGIGPHPDVRRGEQFADQPERRTLLPQLDNAILEGHELCVTVR